MNKRQKELIESVLGKDVVDEKEIIEKHGDPYLTPGSGIIMARPDMKCAFCGKTNETRPYGPKGEEICFDCAMKDDKTKATTERQMNRVLSGDVTQ